MAQKRDNLEYRIILILLRQELHSRGIAQVLRMPHATVQRRLIALEKENVVDFTMTGKNKVYMLKRNIFARQYIFSSEHFKLVSLLVKYPLLEPVIEDMLLKSMSSIIMLFGSHANMSAGKTSDIDVYMEGAKPALKNDLEEMHSRLNIKTGSLDNDSILAKEIMKNHIILRGVEKYYEKIGFFKQFN